MEFVHHMVQLSNVHQSIHLHKRYHPNSDYDYAQGVQCTKHVRVYVSAQEGF
jgi:hypothetical protein